ncbi:hypothetical protein E2L07_08575 [Halalkalibacterium halodurans]|uniref:hypothetical protein n=1 Tax=Halalkalibacterium halodurans TaxID=86665 RepID=UPI00106865B9|nr:hypothetical protein [Halalkalibacterium halodurans]MDY7223478.1 hypothetical protein [Halalkalibacterium halodurans]MDY7242699.1 hypothetical protein [Halalkalibacterium halodurans]MED4126450.1 hypothetical protein [Halalkalibacterium halodurans]MED4162050.1 hypothetical protein [Halalkalibacterium halodurans]TES54969.1 hypothetical protein E2L07_08575 [Halalkalibacterium halodurans]
MNEGNHQGSEKKKKTNRSGKYNAYKWPTIIMITGLILSFFYKYGDMIFEDKTVPEAVTPEIQESIRETQEAFAQEREASMVEETIQPVELFLQRLADHELEAVLSQIVEPSYQSIIRENLDHPLFEQLIGAEIAEVFYPHRGLSLVAYCLLVNKETDVQAIVGVELGQIAYIYADDWNESQEDIEKYESLLEEIKQNED